MSARATAKNRHGLHRRIPAAVEREVRQRCKFGCVICRAGFYDYHHIDPPFQKATVHDPDKICLLCPSCHAQCHRGMLSAASVAAKYQETRRAPAAHLGPPAGPLDYYDGTAQLLLGGLRYSPAVRVLLRYHGTPLITVMPGTGGRPGAINAVFTDDAGNPTLQLVENRWVGPTEAWDIKVERARIQVQTAPGRPVLCLRLEPPGTLEAEQLDMRFKNAHVLANEHAYAVGRYLPDGRIFWFTANVVIPASHANGAAIEFMTPAQAARQL